MARQTCKACSAKEKVLLHTRFLLRKHAYQNGFILARQNQILAYCGRSAGSSLYSGLKTGYDQLTVESSDKEKVTFLKFGTLEYCNPHGTETSLPVLLLGYELGFQIWLLQDAVKEIVSRRDHKIRSHILSALGNAVCPCLPPIESSYARYHQKVSMSEHA